MVDYASFKGRMTISGTLKLMSPMHIGSGFAAALHSEKDANDKSIEVGGIVLGEGDKPVIPSTSLKGAMRALLEQAGIDEGVIEALFGTIKDSNKADTSQNTGRQGCLVPLTATLKAPGKTNKDMGVELDSTIAGAVLTQRTAINDVYGVPEKGKLFVRQQLAPGATFSFRMNLMRDALSVDEKKRAAVAGLLATLRSDGIYLGSGRGDGNGLLKLAGDVSFGGIRIKGGEVKNLDQNEVRKHYGAGQALTLPGAVFRLILSTDDPFFVLSSKKDDAREDRSEGANNKLRAMRTADSLPELPATSLMGALKARAEWLEALRPKRQEGEERKLLLAEIFGIESDEVKKQEMREAIAQGINGRNKVRTDALNARRREQDISAAPGKPRVISAAQITGFAGMLRVKSITPESASIQTIPSVKIDRFTQSPMDRALFETEAFVGPRFEVTLALDHRAEPEHVTFVNDLIANLTRNGVNSGLMLGHASNRGYGWFKVEKKTETAR